MDIFSKIHGTTSDRFKIGQNNQKNTLTGQTLSDEAAQLSNRDDVKFVATSTVFFTAYIVGQGQDNTAAYEVKGCYILEKNILSGYVTNTYVDTNSFTEPTISFNANNEMIISCTGLLNEVINWIAIVEFTIV